MTPSTLVRRPRGPFSFIGHIAAALEAQDRTPKPATKRHACVATLDDGRRCGLTARYVDFKRGGHVCFEHKPQTRQEALVL